jgi:hypothetical protein
MSLCLASLLTIYFRFACLGRRQNPAFWRRGTQRGVFKKTKSSGSGKESPRLPKTGSTVLELRFGSAFKSRSSATIVGCGGAEFRRWIENELPPDRLEVGQQREESRESKRR